MRLLLLLLLPTIAAAQDPAWQPVPAGDMRCGAVMRAVDQVQIYCYVGTKLPINELLVLEVGHPMISNHKRQKDPVTVAAIDPSALGGSILGTPNPATTTIIVFDKIKWTFTLVGGAIEWVCAATDGMAGTNIFPGTFTKIYGVR